ncbi:MAG: glycerol-3-phosphate 1-O-acyltransferase [Cyanobacteria bacterium J083]|nr:MAG: glycerol-3-phosphate 1-O-acyltransferase [Cyanobacteria bacterium J083]
MNNSVLTAIGLIIIAYFFGSIPTGYILGKLIEGIDIREHGSGSTGATNVLRTLGKSAGATVLLIDTLKGAIALLLVKGAYLYYPQNLPESWQPWLITTAGIAAIIGHSKSIWLQFTGGKSVATSLGVLLVMNPLVALSALASFALSIAVSRIVSLSSIIAAIAVVVAMIALAQPLPYIIFAIFTSIYVIWRHRSNIQRLLQS